MNLDQHFPRYTDFDPAIPVWCITPNEGRCIHRFFDSPAVSPSGRYVAVFRMPFEDRQPRPGDMGEVCVVDLATGQERAIAKTAGWEPQLGANVNWGGSDAELYYNDVDLSDWRAFAWCANPLTGARKRLAGPVYHASLDGRYLVSPDVTKTRVCQPGYGVIIPSRHIRRNDGAVEDDGFYLTDTATGSCRLLLSLQRIFREAQPRMQVDLAAMPKHHVYGFHARFNPQGNRLMMCVRWFPSSFGGVRSCLIVLKKKALYASRTRKLEWGTFATACRPVRMAFVTAQLDGTDIRCAIGPEYWSRGGHHPTWYPDGERIVMNLNVDGRRGIRFAEGRWDGVSPTALQDDIRGTGHPTITPDGRHILTDAYTGDHEAFGDGTVPLRWINVSTGEERCLVRVSTQARSVDPVLRVDPHPAWDRSYRFVTFNASAGGTRRVYMADMSSVL